ncbi:thioredoxin domain-containing protein [Microbacterium sp.]|uniref:DsbA family protein n=1 Tax=Microbacterium sp. TaxID=51671 RepID=UPI0025E2A3E3|nr:thioredoxin domain-containing protein [Microbacterium sp.]MBT9605110.1 thioredoxin domain-containing protein [Microbacterium sp.]
MKINWKPTIITAAVATAVIAGAAIYGLVNQNNTRVAAEERGGGSVAVVRDDSHVLDEAGADAVTVVEFLDFECEACGAYYPVVEDLRLKYEGQINYVVRYFPLPGHINSETSAVAAEAAARQGRFEEMYKRLFETQSQWGESQQSQAELFRSYATELGLDMAAYDEAVADPTTLERVRSDLEDGRVLGVDRTPTFFVDGEPLIIERWNDLENAITTRLDGTP